MGADLTLDTAWAVGFVAAVSRLAAFVMASPLLARRIPLPGRLAIAVAGALFLAEPIEGDPGVAEFVSIVAVNVAVGVVLGFVTGLVFHLFAIAGSLIDLSSGLGIGAEFDPLTGVQSTVFSRLFDYTALVIFLAIGGDRLLMAGLDASVRAIPLGGTISLDPGLVDVIVDTVGWILVTGIQVAMPAMAALFLTEIVLGVGSRLLPQANVFLVGLPLKQLLAVSLAIAVVATFPSFVNGMAGDIEDLFVDALVSLRP